MAKLLLSLPYSYSEENIDKWLSDRQLLHLKSHDSHYISAGDALKSVKGVIARVVDICYNEVDELFITITIANNKLSHEEMDEQFNTCTPIEDTTEEIRCGGYYYWKNF